MLNNDNPYIIKKTCVSDKSKGLPTVSISHTSKVLQSFKTQKSLHSSSSFMKSNITKGKIIKSEENSKINNENDYYSMPTISTMTSIKSDLRKNTGMKLINKLLNNKKKKSD